MNYKKIFLTAFILVLSVQSLYTLNTIFSADINFKQGKIALSQGIYDSALLYFNSAIEKNPNESYYYEGRSQSLVFLSLLSEKPEDRKALKDLALKDLEYGFNLNPKNLRFIRNNISTYYFLGVKNTEMPVTYDYDFRDTVKDYFYFIKTAYPTDVGILVDLYKYEKLLGWEEDYIVTLDRIKSLRPDLLDWHPYLIN